MHLKSHSPMLDNCYGGGRKRIFIGLLCATCFAMILALLLFFILPWLGENSDLLRYASLATGCVGILILSWLCVILVFHIYTGNWVPGLKHVRHVMIRVLLPMMEIVGKILGIDKNLVRRSFIKVNNEFVLANYSPVSSDKILLLLPHCLQFGKCSRRLLFSLNNCASCGKCQLGYLRALSERYGFGLAIATGGTIARRIVVEYRPAYIIAIACERDLSSGIQDSYPVPVFGILNERPNGPCRDTLVPLVVLHRALSFFLNEEINSNLIEISPARRDGGIG